MEKTTLQKANELCEIIGFNYVKKNTSYWWDNPEFESSMYENYFLICREYCDFSFVDKKLKI